jgi:cytosine/uracil/thiamine/allantoin permease
MSNNKWKDDLTPFERTAYRWIAYSGLATVFYCVLMLRKYPTSTVFFVIGLSALVVAAVFGGGYSKSVRVLDMRRFDRRSGEHNSRRD